MRFLHLGEQEAVWTNIDIDDALLREAMRRSGDTIPSGTDSRIVVRRHMVIVDATVWIDYLGGTTLLYTSWLNLELTRQRLGLTDLILCEVLQGIRDDAVFTQVHHDLLRFQVFMTGGVASAGDSELASRGIRGHRILCLRRGRWC